jgi:hypothetical protein
LLLSPWLKYSFDLFLKLDELFFDGIKGSLRRETAKIGGLVSSAGPVGATNREEGLLDGHNVDALFDFTVNDDVDDAIFIVLVVHQSILYIM